MGKSVSSIGEGAFFSCTALENVSLDCSIIEIDSRTFYSCKSLKSISFPSTVKTIGYSAFNWCTNLKEVFIPASVVNIASRAFLYCDSLRILIFEDGDTELTIDGGASYLDNASFYNPPLDSLYLGRNLAKMYVSRLKLSPFGNVKKVTIGNLVNTLEDFLFNTCSKISHVGVSWQVPITINENVFSSTTYSNAKLYIPDGTKAAYQATTGWKNFAHILPTSFEVTITASTGGNVMIGDTLTVSNGSAQMWVKRESTVAFCVTADEGYELVGVMVNGKDRMQDVADGVLEIATISDDVEVVFSFGKIEPEIAGDMDGDGEVTIEDVKGLVSSILGKLGEQDEDTKAKADLNGDGQITIADLTKLVNILLGKE